MTTSFIFNQDVLIGTTRYNSSGSPYSLSDDVAAEYAIRNWGTASFTGLKTILMALDWREGSQLYASGGSYAINEPLASYLVREAFGTISGSGTGLVAPGTIRNLTASSTGDTPVVFGQPFAKGDVPSGSRVSVRNSGGTISYTTQQSQEVFYDDGSLCFAEISAIIPSGIAANGTLAVSLYSESGTPNRTSGLTVANVNASAGLDLRLDCVSAMASPDDGTWSIAVNDWLAGPEFNPATGFGANPPRGWMVISQGPVHQTWVGHCYANKAGSRHVSLQGRIYLRKYTSAAGGEIELDFMPLTANCFAGLSGGVGTTAIRLDYQAKLYSGATLIKTIAVDNTVPINGAAVNARHNYDTGYYVCRADGAWNRFDANGTYINAGPILRLEHDVDYFFSTNQTIPYDTSFTGQLGVTAVDYTPYTLSLQGDFDLYNAEGRMNGTERNATSVFAMLNPSDTNARKAAIVDALALASWPTWDINEETGFPFLMRPDNTGMTWLGTAYPNKTRRQPLDGTAYEINKAAGTGGAGNLMLSGDGFTLPWKNSSVNSTPPYETVAAVEADHIGSYPIGPYLMTADPRLMDIQRAQALRMICNSNNNTSRKAGTDPEEQPAASALTAPYSTLVSAYQARSTAWGMACIWSATRYTPDFLGDGTTEYPLWRYYRQILSDNFGYMLARAADKSVNEQAIGNWGYEGESPPNRVRLHFHKFYLGQSIGLIALHNDLHAADAKTFVNNLLGHFLFDGLTAPGITDAYIHYYPEIPGEYPIVADETGAFYPDWPTVWSQTFTFHGYTTPPVGTIVCGVSTNEYVFDGLVALNILDRAGIAGARAAYDLVWARLPAGAAPIDPNGTYGWRDDPTYAIKPLI